MPYFPNAQSWLENSTLLLSARPSTTRITTKYTILCTPAPSTVQLSNPQSASTSTPGPPPSKAYLVLKTYDPVSGTCLKYRTDKAADVGRLVAALGRCGRVMAALPEGKEEGKEDVKEGETKTVVEKEIVGEQPKIRGKEVKAGQGKAGGGGAGGKKKKGKK
ncbi:hypothetical protein MMC12_004742 [Toensbergia leucococca]|nr:hypothetical protein [Toensbergia leucococca]